MEPTIWKRLIVEFDHSSVFPLVEYDSETGIATLGYSKMLTYGNAL